MSFSDVEGRSMEYAKPAVEDYGHLSELTAANEDGSQTDADYPAGTGKGDLTFS